MKITFTFSPRLARRSTLALSAGLVLFSGVTPVSAGEAQSQPPTFALDWTGPYLGVNVGAAVPLHAHERLQAIGEGSLARDLFPPTRDRIGATFGLQAGHNWRYGPYVYGLEIDMNAVDGRGGPTGLFLASPAFWPQGVAAYGLARSPSANFAASLRGRFGFALGLTLLYATGGVASGGARGPATLYFPGAAEFFRTDMSQSSRMKYAIGAGIERAIAPGWSARLEYLFLSQSLNTQIFSKNDEPGFVARNRNENHIIRAGLNAHFGPDGDALPAPVDVVPREWVNLHIQTTNVVQGYPKFPALYTGPASFTPKGQARVGSFTTAFLGLHVWPGASLYVNPEINWGFGLSNSVGAAGFVNGAVARFGRAAPYLRFQRYFLHQTVGLGGQSESLGDAPNQLTETVDSNHLTFVIGKFSPLDMFDNNSYAHDFARGFLNFSINAMGAFDYAADAWGYTHGAAAAWVHDSWTARAGVFQLTEIPNGQKIEPAPFRQFMPVTEFETRYELFGAAGKVRLLAFGDYGFLSKASEVVDFALATGILPPDVSNLRRRALKLGGGINIEHALTPEIGLFLRASMTDGRYETVDYTDIDRSLSGGFSLAGSLWGRADDAIGVGFAVNGLVGSRVRYFALGGRSDHIGDGALKYGGEQILETFYRCAVLPHVEASLDYQFLHNPAYNMDRGPVSVFGIRLHSEF